MSGGAFNYTCYRVEEEYVGKMCDPELDELMTDLVEILHDLEWWISGDTTEEDYRETVAKFKKKWLKADEVRIGGIVQKIVDDAINKIQCVAGIYTFDKEDKT